MESDQSPLAKYLDAVEAVLLEQKVSRSERATILGELESQIYTMANAKLEEGGVISDALLENVIESLDPPESYRQVNVQSSAEPSLETSSTSENSNNRDSLPPFVAKQSSKVSAWRKEIQEYLGRPRMDELAIISCGLLVLSILVGLTTRFHREGLFLTGSVLFIACCFGCISIYRIKRSKSKLWGGGLAFVGAIAFPALLVNIAAIAISIETRLGFLLIAAAIAYVNYRLLLRVWNWIGCSRMRHKPAAALDSPMPTSHETALS